MGLLSGIYNTVAKFFRPQEEQGEASKSVAANRLKLVLMQDRTNLTPKILEQMRSELIDLLSRYVELDKDLLDLNFEQEGNQVALMLSIPVIRAKDEDEIEAAIKAHKEAMEDSAEETDDSAEDAECTETETSEDDEECADSQEENNDDRTEEEKAEAQKADAIANELKDVKKIIKKKEKKEISAPSEISNNPFKSDGIENVDKIESSSEA